MKISHIVAILVIAVAIAAIISTAGDASMYVSFREAAQMAQEGNTNKIHVVGRLFKDDKGEIRGMVYQPQLNPNYFEFMLVDQNNESRKVIYTNPKPQDFERSEQIVVIGYMKPNGIFLADKILMKCPSKYKENEIKV